MGDRKWEMGDRTREIGDRRQKSWRGNTEQGRDRRVEEGKRESGWRRRRGKEKEKGVGPR